MSSLTECERQVIEKLIVAFTTTLNCQSQNDSTNGIVDSGVSVVEKVLRVLLSVNDTISIGDSGGMRTIVQGDDYSIVVSTLWGIIDCCLTFCEV